jgi:hypothetical protein
MSQQPPEENLPPSEMFNREQAVHGDFVGGEKIGFNDIGGSFGVAVGRGTQSSVVQQAVQTNGLSEQFQAVYQQILLRPEDPSIGKDELTSLVRRIEEETFKREGANLPRLERWLGILQSSAEDIYRRTLEALASPYAASEIQALASSSGHVQPSGGSQAQATASVTFAGLQAQLQAGPWTKDEKNRLVGLLDYVKKEMESQGEQANLGMIAHSLEEITTADPEMRRQLYAWLVDSEAIPRPVRIIARKVLANY